MKTFYRYTLLCVTVIMTLFLAGCGSDDDTDDLDDEKYNIVGTWERTYFKSGSKSYKHILVFDVNGNASGRDTQSNQTSGLIWTYNKKDKSYTVKRAVSNIYTLYDGSYRIVGKTLIRDGKEEYTRVE